MFINIVFKLLIFIYFIFELKDFVVFFLILGFIFVRRKMNMLCDVDMVLFIIKGKFI